MRKFYHYEKCSDFMLEVAHRAMHATDKNGVPYIYLECRPMPVGEAHGLDPDKLVRVSISKHVVGNERMLRRRILDACTGDLLQVHGNVTTYEMTRPDGKKDLFQSIYAREVDHLMLGHWGQMEAERREHSEA